MREKVASTKSRESHENLFAALARNVASTSCHGKRNKCIAFHIFFFLIRETFFVKKLNSPKRETGNKGHKNEVQTCTDAFTRSFTPQRF